MNFREICRRFKGMMSEKELMLLLSLLVGVACGLASTVPCSQCRRTSRG